MVMRDPKVIRRARRLRKEATVAERELWEHIRGKQLNGWRFRRQADIAGFVADFLCHDPKLVVELDGPVHDEPEQEAFDAQRDEKMRAEGYAVLRLDEAMVRIEIGQAVLIISYVGKRIVDGLPPFPDDLDEE